jgi:hypothetical protein
VIVLKYISAFILRIIDEITQNVMGENIDFETVKKISIE